MSFVENVVFCFCIVLQVLVAITRGSDSPTMCFDVVSKSWKHLAYMSQPQLKAFSLSYQGSDMHLAAEHVGNHLYVADSKYNVHCYSIDQNSWEELPRSPCSIDNLCGIGDHLYAIGNYNRVPQRYSFSQCRWQPIAKLSDCSDTECRYYAGATVFNSKLYVVYGRAQETEGNNTWGFHQNYSVQNAMSYRFDPRMNHWELLSNTCEPHFDSILFVVNDKLCVAGGYKSVGEYKPCGEEASVEVYNFEMKYWLIVQQSHIPQNNLGAIEVEGRVYFIINKFPIDSGIRISPGELYPVHLGEWKNLRQVDRNALLCYLPVKRKTLTAK